MDKYQDEEGYPKLLILCENVFYTAHYRECRYTGGWDSRLGCGWYHGRWYDGGNGMKNVKMYDDSDSRCGEEHEMDDDT